MNPVLKRAAKRALDIVMAGALLVLTAPLVAVVAIAVRCFLGSPVVFRQQRPGRHGKPFDMMKFRSMSNARDANGALLPDAQRLTAFGQWLRRTSIDELPELWCVLRGDMSMVGPRPLLMEYLPLYSAEQARRHSLRPGITGWAQVNGRNAITWEQKFELDIWYVEHQSLRLDLRILLMTLGALTRRSDVSAPGSVTMPKFTGSHREPVS